MALYSHSLFYHLLSCVEVIIPVIAIFVVVVVVVVVVIVVVIVVFIFPELIVCKD